MKMVSDTIRDYRRVFENTSTTKKFNPDNRSVSTLIAWYLERVPNSLDLHSLSEVLLTALLVTFSWVVEGLVYLGYPMGVLICCYAMRSNIFKPCWTASHLVSDSTNYQAKIPSFGIVSRDWTVCAGFWHCPTWSISCTSGAGTVHTGLIWMCDG